MTEQDPAGVGGDVERQGESGRVAADQAEAEPEEGEPGCAAPAPVDRHVLEGEESGGRRETVTLTPQGENSLKGDAKNPIAAGATITLTIKTADGKSGQVKFKK